MGSKKTKASAFAPATVGNVAVGFDILGFALGGLGDTVTVSKSKVPGEVLIESVGGVTRQIPVKADKNTASVAVQKLFSFRSLSYGFKISIQKGIPLGSGLGGSAASAVAAVVAANALLDKALSAKELFACALAGESVASGAVHGDNVAPCLFGGLNLVLSSEPMDVLHLPVPKGVHCLMIHPDVEVETKAARKVLRPQVLLAEHVHQSALLAGFVAGCFKGDIGLLRRTMMDTIVEPQRAHLIPHFDETRGLLFEAGAIGFSISGAGPSMFAWVTEDFDFQKIREQVLRLYGNKGMKCDVWSSPVSAEGAKIVENV